MQSRRKKVASAPNVGEHVLVLLPLLRKSEVAELHTARGFAIQQRVVQLQVPRRISKSQKFRIWPPITGSNDTSKAGVGTLPRAARLDFDWMSTSLHK